MFDVTSRITYKNIPNWHRDVMRVWARDNYCGPMVLVGNKVDIKDRHVKPKDINFHRKKNLQYYDVSCKSNYNLEKPFLWLLRRLTGCACFWFFPPLPRILVLVLICPFSTFVRDPNLCFVDMPVTAPPEFTIDAGQIKQYEEALALASTVPLVVVDDDDEL